MNKGFEKKIIEIPKELYTATFGIRARRVLTSFGRVLKKAEEVGLDLRKEDLHLIETGEYKYYVHKNLIIQHTPQMEHLLSFMLADTDDIEILREKIKNPHMPFEEDYKFLYANLNGVNLVRLSGVIHYRSQYESREYVVWVRRGEKINRYVHKLFRGLARKTLKEIKKNNKEAKKEQLQMINNLTPNT